MACIQPACGCRAQLAASHSMEVSMQCTPKISRTPEDCIAAGLCHCMQHTVKALAHPEVAGDEGGNGPDDGCGHKKQQTGGVV